MDDSLNHPLAAVLADQDRSAAWLSKKAGFDPSYAHKVINGQRQPSALFKSKAAEILSVPEELLFPEHGAPVQAA